MHKQNFVLAVKANNKSLREFDGKVYLPFGSEYTIFLKNLDSRKARVQIFIDGQDALDGTKLVVDGKSQVDLKRFIKNGNFEQGNSFKFIEKTEKISKHRGDRAEDGLITIHYEYEYALPKNYGPLVNYREYEEPRKWAVPYPPYNTVWYSSTAEYHLSDSDEARAFYSANLGGGTTTCASNSSNLLRSKGVKSFVNDVSQSEVPTFANTNGVTAPGSINDQKFVPASYFWGDGTIHTMTLEMKGETPDTKVTVQKPVTVKKLKRCSMCGTNVRQVAKFCHECGSSVEVV